MHSARQREARKLADEAALMGHAQKPNRIVWSDSQ
jgi:hypothetical protein